MATLRIAATLAHALPTLRVRIRHGERTLLEVAHPGDSSGPAMGACAFRRAVACAHEQTKRGQRLAFMGFAEDMEPAIDIGVRPGDATLPGGIYRVAVGDEVIHGFATTLPARRCRELVAERSNVDRPVRLHHDAATEVTFVHTVDSRDAPVDMSHLEHLLGALWADEVVRELASPH